MRRNGLSHAAARRPQRGFTLVELIISMVLISLLSLVAAPLLRIPMVAWMDASRRAGLSNDLDLAHTKLAEDLRRALPGSVRVRTVGARTMLEYMEVRAYGRFRAGPSGAAQVCPATCFGPGMNDVLQAACSETCFTHLGTLEGDPPVPGTDWVVADALGGNVYLGGNVAVAGGSKSRLTAYNAGSGRVDLAAHVFPAVAASKRFYLVSNPVTYECDLGTQRLTRYWGYPVSALQPAAFGGGSNAPLATGVQACSLRYVPAGGLNKGGVVNVTLRLARAAADTQVNENADLEASFAVSEGP